VETSAQILFVLPASFWPRRSPQITLRSLQTPAHLTMCSPRIRYRQPWFDGKVDFAPPVKDFASQDFRLYGGRLEYLNNRAVATLVTNAACITSICYLGRLSKLAQQAKSRSNVRDTT